MLVRKVFRDDSGMSTVEYAIGMLAAAAFAMILYAVLTGNLTLGLLQGLVQRAFTVSL
nr:DUF4244 domain-containing protein [Saccharothrix ecbatanensis]